MKSPEEKVDALLKLNSFELDMLKGVVSQIQQIIDSPATKEHALQAFENASRDLSVIKWTYTRKIISLLKRGYTID